MNELAVRAKRYQSCLKTGLAFRETFYFHVESKPKSQPINYTSLASLNLRLVVEPGVGGEGVALSIELVGSGASVGVLGGSPGEGIHARA